MSPDFLTPGARRRRRWPLWLAAVIVVTGAIVGIAALLDGGDKAPAPQPAARPQPRPVPKAKPKPIAIPPKPGPGRDWPLYGNGPGRTRHMRDVNLKPPYRRVWSLNGGELSEVQAGLGG